MFKLHFANLFGVKWLGGFGVHSAGSVGFRDGSHTQREVGSPLGKDLSEERAIRICPEATDDVCAFGQAVAALGNDEVPTLTFRELSGIDNFSFELDFAQLGLAWFVSERRNLDHSLDRRWSCLSCISSRRSWFGFRSGRCRLGRSRWRSRSRHSRCRLRACGRLCCGFGSRFLFG